MPSSSGPPWWLARTRACHGVERVADAGGQLAGHEQPEAPVPQRGQAAGGGQGDSSAGPSAVEVAPDRRPRRGGRRSAQRDGHDIISISTRTAAGGRLDLSVSRSKYRVMTRVVMSRLSCLSSSG